MDILILILLVFLGAVLLVTEIALVPGFGVTGIMGVITMLSAILYAFFGVGNLAGWVTMAVVLLVCLLLILWAVYGRSLDKVALTETIDSSVGDPKISNLAVGQKGIAVTRLASIGNVDFDGVLVEASAQEGAFVNPGDTVVITRMESGVVYVKVVK